MSDEKVMSNELEATKLQFVEYLMAPGFSLKEAKSFFKAQGIVVDEEEFFSKDGKPLTKKIDELALICAKAYINEEEASDIPDTSEEVETFTDEENISNNDTAEFTPDEEESIIDEPMAKEEIVEEETAIEEDGDEIAAVAENKEEEADPEPTYTYTGKELGIKELKIDSLGLLPLSKIKTQQNIRGEIIKNENYDIFAENIRVHGVTQAVTIDKKGTLIAGYRRYEASKDVGHKVIPVKVVDAKDTFIIQVTENLLKEDLHAIDYCFAILKAYEDYNWEAKEIRKIFKINESTTSRIVNNIKNIPVDCIQRLRTEQPDISYSTVLELSELKNEDDIRSLLDSGAKLKLSHVRSVAASRIDSVDSDEEENEEEESVSTKEDGAVSLSPKETVKFFNEDLLDFRGIISEFTQVYGSDNTIKSMIDKETVSDLMDLLNILIN